jgi:hypothetical protein
MTTAIRQQSGEICAGRQRPLFGGEPSPCENKNVDLYIATGKQKHNEPSSSRGRILKSATGVDSVEHRVTTEAGRAINARRETVVEPVSGQVKQAQGFSQVLLRDAEIVCAEWALEGAIDSLSKRSRVCTP